MENNNAFKINLGQYQKEYEDSLLRAQKEKIIERIWQKDFTVWSNKPDEITNRLGWLQSPAASLASLNEIEEFVASVRKDGFTHALLLGMGGSSLAPEVFSITFGVGKDYLDLAVLDSTNPGAVLECSKKYNPEKTLYIVSTKSGGTVETFSFMKYFFNLTAKVVGVENAGKHFAAITDPGSGLESTAKQLNFRKIFLNDPNIGGRYSALSLFGMVPAALAGINIKELLNNTLQLTDTNKNSSLTEADTSTKLGVIMGTLANLGIDKVTFLTSSGISHFGIWVEQLIAESTGKIGRGILPVVGEEILSPEFYSRDRLFVYLKLAGDNSQDIKIDSLRTANFPVVEIVLDNIYSLGAEMFRWEIATAVASWLTGIQPFDQPNVESAKILARKMVQEYSQIGSLPKQSVALEENGIEVYGNTTEKYLGNILNAFLYEIELYNNANPLKRYVSIHAYLTPTEATTKVLQILRTKIQKKYKTAVTIGYGPRFLHSTGQLHKGDAGNGIFIQILSNIAEDAPIPDEAGKEKSTMSFGVLINAQALGDCQALVNNNRKVLTLNLLSNEAEKIKNLAELI
jgi:glucose-6-phosphate isomerase